MGGLAVLFRDVLASGTLNGLGFRSDDLISTEEVFCIDLVHAALIDENAAHEGDDDADGMCGGQILIADKCCL